MVNFYISGAMLIMNKMTAGCGAL